MSLKFEIQPAENPVSEKERAARLPRRETPELCQKPPALQSEGAGNAGRPMRPIAAYAMADSKKHTR